jgi:hypothetical protein
MLDDLMKDNEKLKKTFREKPPVDVIEVCAGCDNKTYESGQWERGKNYCPRCLEEVRAMYKEETK